MVTLMMGIMNMDTGTCDDDDSADDDDSDDADEGGYDDE